MTAGFFLATLYHTKNYQGTITASGSGCAPIGLYHTKNYQGTITFLPKRGRPLPLYHTKNYQGTITLGFSASIRDRLYHTKNYQGTVPASPHLRIIFDYTTSRGKVNRRGTKFYIIAFSYSNCSVHLLRRAARPLAAALSAAR